MRLPPFGGWIKQISRDRPSYSGTSDASRPIGRHQRRRPRRMDMGARDVFVMRRDFWRRWDAGDSGFGVWALVGRTERGGVATRFEDQRWDLRRGPAWPSQNGKSRPAPVLHSDALDQHALALIQRIVVEDRRKARHDGVGRSIERTPKKKRRALADAPLQNRTEKNQAWRCSIMFLISAIALAGFSPFGQARAQFMMVWQR